MNFYEVIEKRRTTRQFTSEPVPKETVKRIIKKAGLTSYCAAITIMIR